MNLQCFCLPNLNWFKSKSRCLEWQMYLKEKCSYWNAVSENEVQTKKKEQPYGRKSSVMNNFFVHTVPLIQSRMRMFEVKMIQLLHSQQCFHFLTLKHPESFVAIYSMPQNNLEKIHLSSLTTFWCNFREVYCLFMWKWVHPTCFAWFCYFCWFARLFW